MSGRQNTSGSSSGPSVDRAGTPVVDPTKNVLDLVNAESKFQNALRDAEARHSREVQDWSDKYQNAMRDAESKRQDDLAELRVRYETQMSNVLTVQVKTTSDLISTQLDKVTSALGEQITTSVAALTNSQNASSSQLLARIGQLEQFRWEVGGRTSVQDPAMSQALTSMANAISALQAGDQQGHGRTMARGEIISWIIAAIAVGSFVVLLINKAHT